MIYLDSCALVKLVRTEDGSSALQEWLDERVNVTRLFADAVARVVCTHRQGDSTYRELLGDRLHLIGVWTRG